MISKWTIGGWSRRSWNKLHLFSIPIPSCELKVNNLHLLPEVEIPPCFLSINIMNYTSFPIPIRLLSHSSKWLNNQKSKIKCEWFWWLFSVGLRWKERERLLGLWFIFYLSVCVVYIWRHLCCLKPWWREIWRWARAKERKLGRDI